MNTVLCNVSSSRLGYLGNLSSFMVGKKIWWECCFSQNHRLSLKITLVNQYLSKCDVEECSLIPNSQHCHLSMIGSLVVKFDFVAKNILGVQLSCINSPVELGTNLF